MRFLICTLIGQNFDDQCDPVKIQDLKIKLLLKDFLYADDLVIVSQTKLSSVPSPPGERGTARRLIVSLSEDGLQTAQNHSYTFFRTEMPINKYQK